MFTTLDPQDRKGIASRWPCCVALPHQGKQIITAVLFAFGRFGAHNQHTVAGLLRLWEKLEELAFQVRGH